jgi:hypothetical protein
MKRRCPLEHGFGTPTSDLLPERTSSVYDSEVFIIFKLAVCSTAGVLEALGGILI